VCAEGCAHTTIQAALDDPATQPGAIIYVTDAVHTEAGVVVGKDVTIRGRAADQTVVQADQRAGQARDRVFLVPAGVSAGIEDMAIRHGYPRADIRSGGAIENHGTLSVSRCVIHDNQANCGGGIYNEGGALTVVDSTIRDNQADGEGPIGYECGAGGAIKLTEGGTLALANSTLSDNRAKLRGGGLHVSCRSTATLTNSTISGNFAGGRGGGINIGGTLHLTHCTISGNSAKGVMRGNQVDRQPAGGVAVRGTLHYTNTLIANNPKAGDCILGGSGVVGANAHNWVEDGGCSPEFWGDPGLEDLADNGGHSATRALPPGSPAVDVIPADACPLASDQRGYPRPAAQTAPDTPCDVGAFELGEPGPVSGAVNLPGDSQAAPPEVEGWAVLAEKDDYRDVDMTDLPVDYMGVVRMRAALEEAGWEAEHIRELREFDRETLTEGLDWLADNADADDVALLYVAGHGRYLRNVLGWGEFFPAEWREVTSGRRLLVVDSCQAAAYTRAVADDPAPYLSIAAVAEDEFGWCGLEEEGLPIIGYVFTHYFSDALGDPAADSDGDGLVSVQEAARLAEVGQRAYMHDVVLAVPEFLEMYHQLGLTPEEDPDFPHVVVDDAIGEPVYLELEGY
jgi:hypothetical protein